MSNYSFGSMFGGLLFGAPPLFQIFFLLIFGMILFVMIRGLMEWHQSMTSARTPLKRLVVAIQFPSPSRVSHLTAKYSSPDTPGEEATEGHCPALTDIPPGLAIGRNAQQLYPASCPRSKAKGREQGPPSAYTT